MTTFSNLSLAAAILAFSALPSLAETNVPTLTCGTFTALDSVMQLATANDVLLWSADSANSSAAGGVPQQIEKYGKEDLSSFIALHCTDRAADINVIKLLQEPH